MIELKGAAVSAQIKEQVQKALAKRPGPPPKLAIIRVGENPDDLSYEKGARKKLESFGLRSQSFSYPKQISHARFCEAFLQINQDPDVDGILLLLPLPAQIRFPEIAQAIDPKKDVDGISPVNIAKVFAGETDGFAPCTAEAVMEILSHYGVETAGKRAVVVGRSMVVGRPLSMLLLQQNATVTICHTRTRNPELVCRDAELLVAAAGQRKMLDERYVGKDAVVVDVGIHVDQEGKLCGDVDFDRIRDCASMATPVPGGVGSVTTAVLAKHLMRAAGAFEE